MKNQVSKAFQEVCMSKFVLSVVAVITLLATATYAQQVIIIPRALIDERPFQVQPPPPTTAPTVEVVVQLPPQVVKTIDIDTWIGYHAGSRVRLNLQSIEGIVLHVATDGTVTTYGSAIHTVSNGIWFTREPIELLSGRLSQAGWGTGMLPPATQPSP
jgi:hypothetical protein